MLQEEVGRKYGFENVLVGKSEPLQRIFSIMDKAAKSTITVSLSGETGTGKELVAKAIHYNSDRRKKSFVTVNMAAIPHELIESELFGHEKGAFTGASARRLGKFEEANKGTIFLDEIAELDIDLQAKLLRVLQEGEVTRIGSNFPIKIDVRVIVATHKNLVEEVKKNNFRNDLYYRLLGLPIELPPLRERTTDILILAKHFVDEFCKKDKKPKLKISAKAQAKLMKYPFPGNIRELMAIMELSTVMADGPEITENDISFRSTNSLSDFLIEEDSLKEYNKKIIGHYLEKHNNDIKLVAQKLDIGVSTIYRMIKHGDI